MVETAEATVSTLEGNTGQHDSETFFNSYVGLSQAVSITGKNKGQISKDTNTKNLPYVLNEQGHKRYKVADLYNLYGFKKPVADKSETGLKQPEKPQLETLEAVIELAVLKERIQSQAELLRRAEEERRRVEDENRDLRQTRDKLLEQNHRLTLMLPAPTMPEQHQPAAEQPQPSWWKRLFK